MNIGVQIICSVGGLLIGMGICDRSAWTAVLGVVVAAFGVAMLVV